MANLIDAITAPLKAASDAAEKILEVKGILEFGDEIRELHTNVLAGLKAARVAELEQASMQQEILALKREVSDLKASKTKLERYELKRLPPGVYVYALKEAEKGTAEQPYMCVKCFNSGVISPLNSIMTFNGIETLRCITCNSDVKTGYSTPSKPVRVIRDYDIFNP
jgi:hypothetical protein